MMNQQLLALAVAAACGWVTPAVVDLVTKSHLAAGAKAAIAVMLSTLAGVLTTVTLAPRERWQDYLLAVAVAFVNTMAAHQTGYTAPIQRGTASFGIGGRSAPADPLAPERTAA